LRGIRRIGEDKYRFVPERHTQHRRNGPAGFFLVLLRKHKVVLSADISKMYRQILVDEADQILQKKICSGSIHAKKSRSAC
jgi:hypothetical protein